jgi:hypothetical protein
VVICFRCSASTKRKLDELLNDAEFNDYSDIITAAIENLSVLQAEIKQKGSIVLSSSEDRSDDVAVRDQTIIEQGEDLPRPERALATIDSEGTSSSPTLPKHGVDTVRVDRVPVLFKRESIETEPSGSLAPPPADVFFSGQAVPIDRWIFGQFSKLLPAKASCRALANLYPPPAAGFELEKIAGSIAKEAAALGEYLAARDRDNELVRDDAWAVGFPSGANKADRSRLRYANQFVGAIGKQGTLTGLLIDLKLINLAKNGTKRIFLTRPGWDFGLLENPVLDGIASDGKFTPAEVDFLLDHVRQRVPVEDFAFRTVLDAIRQGHDTPDKLDAICKEHLPQKRRKELTSVVVTSQRTGVISRMVDIGLVARRRDGVRVSYIVTDLGNRYADQMAAA